MYAWRRPDTGVAPPNGPALIKPGTPTLPSLLKQAGYRTAIIGKWHLGLGDPPKPDWSGALKPGPLEVGFDESFIVPTTNDRVPCVYVRGHCVEHLDSADPVDVSMTNPDGQPTGVTNRRQLQLDWSHGHNDGIVNGIGRIGFMVGGEQARWQDDRMAETLVHEAQGFLERSHDRPFVLYYAAHQIHVPRVPNAAFVGRTPHGSRGDAVVEFDWCVGQILATLDELGVADNTLVIVTSDNGPVVDDGYRDQAVERLGAHRPAGPFRGGKYSRFEGGCRVPWIASWPGRIKPGVSEALLSQVDLLATLATVAGVANIPAGAATDSQDMAPALLGDSSAGRDSAVTHSGLSSHLALRTKQWKYIEPSPGRAVNVATNTELANSPAPQLYDLDQDPGETKNLASTQSELVSELQNMLDEVKNRRPTSTP